MMAKQQSWSTGADGRRGEAEAVERIERALNRRSTVLDLSGLQLTTLPKELWEFKALTELDLSSNQLTGVPEELGGLKALTKLSLYANQLTGVPKELGELKALTKLSLFNNKLTGVPKELGELKALTELGLSSNKLTGVPKELAGLKALTELYLYNNQLTEVPEELGELKVLTRLHLSNNKLTGVPKELAGLKALTSLDLSNNQLQTVPQELGELRALTSLDLSGNRLTAVPKEFARLKKLQQLFLHDNPRLGLSPEVLGPPGSECKPIGSKDPAKPAEILAYYFARSDETDRPLNEAKILVVGEPGVGKTMLVEWLTKGKARKNPEWTKGIKILRWSVKCAAGAGGDIKVSIWDFGGQEIMQATHQFFLTERSLYLLVVDSRENEEQSKVRYWLDKIRAFGGDSPVIVALNKRDEGRHDPDENRLKLDYPANLLESTFFRTACKAAKGVKAGDGVEELRAAITARVHRLENVTQAVPASYLKAKTAFEAASKARNRMDRKAFDAICVKNGIKNEIGQSTLLSYLKSLGSLFHYKRGDHDHKTLVLDPQWLTGGVYKLLTDHVVKEHGGELTPKDVSRIFARSKAYAGDAPEFILDMMEGDPFELSFRIPDTDGYRLIPELLPPNEPAHGIIPAQSLNVQYHYKFLPSGLIPRFIVRMHNVLKPGDAWKNGVIVVLDGRRVLVRGVREEKRVYVSVQGREPAARRALAIVRQNLDIVHRTMKHLEVSERVALTDQPEITVGYDYLLELERDNGSHYEWRPEGAARKYTVRELLDGIEERRQPERPDASEAIVPLMPELGEVFISYAHEDAEHSAAVRKLADDLRAWGVDAWIDQYVELPGPKEGWTHWMEERIEKARVVLVIPGPKYHDRVKKTDLNPHGGHGAVWEGQLIYQEIYEAKGVTNKFTPVLMKEDHKQFIPKPLRDFNYYKAYETDGFERLYRALTGQPRIVAPPLGKPVVLTAGSPAPVDGAGARRNL